MMLSPTACHRCRQQKRKCSRDLPACHRCREFEVDCDYPLPPNRKLLAAQRLNRRAIHNQDPGSNTVCQVDNRFGLLQSYFSQFITSSILFNKEEIFLNYWDKNIPEFLLRSLLAFSSLFAPRAIQSRLNPRTVDSYTSWNVGDCTSQVDPRVSLAGNVLPFMMPYSSVEDLLASFHLSLYWFAQGQTNRARSIADSAFQFSLQLTLQGQANALEFSPQSALSTFGVYWFIRCFVQEPRSVDPYFVLELPDKPALLTVRKISQSIQAGQLPRCDNAREESYTNFKFMAFMGCWFRVREFVNSLSASRDPVSMISSLIKLDIHMTTCHNSFNTQPRSSPGSISNGLHISLVSEVLYRQCRAVPHIYMFLCNLRKDAAEHEFFQLSAITAVRHILSLTEVINRLLAIIPFGQLSSLPPFIGYSTFLAASLQLGAIVHLQNIYEQPFLDNKGRLLSVLRSCALINLSTLNHLRCFWAPTQTMWEKLLTLVSPAFISMREIETVEPLSRSIPIVDQITTTELESLVSGHLSSILAMIDITEPFYLLIDGNNLGSETYRSSSSPKACGAETTWKAQRHPTHGYVMSDLNEEHQDLPEIHDNDLEQLWDIFF